jgi:hypothetical protein
MNLETILTMTWTAINSPIGIAVVASLVLLLLNWLYSKKPSWKNNEGTIIAAVKWAEKQIPDDASNTAARRLDAALRYVLKVYEEKEKKVASSAVTAELTEGIQIVHANLESSGNLTKVIKAALILLMVGVLAVGGCGAPMGKDISSGTAGGNSIKLDQSHGNVIVLTDGALDPEGIVDAAGNLQPTTQPVEVDDADYVD